MLIPVHVKRDILTRSRFPSTACLRSYQTNLPQGWRRIEEHHGGAAARCELRGLEENPPVL